MSIAPKGLISSISKLQPNAIFFKETQDKIVALTIDDVPTANEQGYPSTQRILNVIAEHNQNIADRTYHARATFFVVSSHLNCGKEIINQMIDQGHEIGNHGVFEHPHFTISSREFEDEIERAHQTLTEGTNASIKWFRPGSGFYNKSMLETLHKMGEMRGYRPQFALASMVPLDTQEALDNPEFTTNYILKFTFPGAILVLHGGKKERAKNTEQALRKLLSRLHQDGYRVITMSQLFST